MAIEQLAPPGVSPTAGPGRPGLPGLTGRELLLQAEQAGAMEAIIAALEALAALPGYRQAVAQRLGRPGAVQPGPLGGCLGYDFHLGPAGPALIEINTNPGGLLLCARPEDGLESAILEIFQQEWRQAGGEGLPRRLLILDESPSEQFLYPEFLAYQALFQAAGIEARIGDPRQLHLQDQRLCLGDWPVDFVYNRLTDFALQQPAHQALRQAYEQAWVVLSPHPWAHALHADKRNLALLTQPERLADWGLSPQQLQVLALGVPRTREVQADNAEALWRQRRGLFFKPAQGYGSKGAYRGDKLTLRVWQTICQGGYVAQDWVAPSRVPGPEGELKLDLRYFVYAGRTLLRVARLYQGQTTNLRTPGGGFARIQLEDCGK
ncbi:MAG: hypothetical protein H7842_11845 [Gammaproteobacteria bacterium SHHR-1]|uniref:hypothetical protein n=1 Tax=Magnetovirga frankeli TaxID=947516 RepID=UPI003279D4B9